MITEVVAALIYRGDRFLVCRRPAHKARGNLWEFVGGKVELGETCAQALIRECREELAIEVEVGELVTQLIHKYPDLTVRLSLYQASIVSGEICLLEHSAHSWVTVAEAEKMPLCPADVEILELLKRKGLTAEILFHGI